MLTMICALLLWSLDRLYSKAFVASNVHLYRWETLPVEQELISPSTHEMFPVPPDSAQGTATVLTVPTHARSAAKCARLQPSCHPKPGSVT